MNFYFITSPTFITVQYISFHFFPSHFSDGLNQYKRFTGRYEIFLYSPYILLSAIFHPLTIYNIFIFVTESHWV